MQSIIIDRNVPAEMEDGTVLRADVYRRSGPGTFPVLLQRTPYDKAGAETNAHNTGADFWSDTELRVAHQKVFHDEARPSRLVLPVIP